MTLTAGPYWGNGTTGVNTGNTGHVNFIYAIAAPSLARRVETERGIWRRQPGEAWKFQRWAK